MPSKTWDTSCKIWATFWPGKSGYFGGISVTRKQRAPFFSLLAFLTVTNGPAPAEAVAEYGFEMPEGLHRCTSKTSSWYLKADSAPEYHERMSSVNCGGNAVECKRDYHLYKMSKINALFIVSDARCEACYLPPFAVGADEGMPARVQQMLLTLLRSPLSLKHTYGTTSTYFSAYLDRSCLISVLESRESCILPKRYRQRPTECFATDPTVITRPLAALA